MLAQLSANYAIAQFALRIKAYFFGLRNMRCAFTKLLAFEKFAL